MARPLNIKPPDSDPDLSFQVSSSMLLRTNASRWILIRVPTLTGDNCGGGLTSVSVSAADDVGEGLGKTFGDDRGDAVGEDCGAELGRNVGRNVGCGCTLGSSALLEQPASIASPTSRQNPMATAVFTVNLLTGKRGSGKKLYLKTHVAFVRITSAEIPKFQHEHVSPSADGVTRDIR